MTYEDARTAYREASEAVEKQKVIVREAETRLNYLEDEKRKAWVVWQDAHRQAMRADLWATDADGLKDLKRMIKNRGIKTDELYND